MRERNSADLQDLNPSLLRFSTPKDGGFDLHLPAGTKKDYETAVTAIPVDKRLWWRYHDVKQGDTLASLARTYHTTAKSIQRRTNSTMIPWKLRAAGDSDRPGKFADTGAYAHRITRY